MPNINNNRVKRLYFPRQTEYFLLLVHRFIWAITKNVKVINLRYCKFHFFFLLFNSLFVNNKINFLKGLKVSKHLFNVFNNEKIDDKNRKILKFFLYYLDILYNSIKFIIIKHSYNTKHHK